MAFSVIRLIDLLNEFGEEFAKELFSDFSCPINEDVEFFLKEKAISFQRMDISRTYLVFGEYQGKKPLVGYFAIALKTLPIRKNVTKTQRRRLTGTKSNEISVIPAILIGQLGKNYTNGYNNVITGIELLWLALKKVLAIHQDVGGRVVFLECSDHPKLKNFYETNGFQSYDINGDGLRQYIRYIEKIELK